MPSCENSLISFFSWVHDTTVQCESTCTYTPKSCLLNIDTYAHWLSTAHSISRLFGWVVLSCFGIHIWYLAVKDNRTACWKIHIENLTQEPLPMVIVFRHGFLPETSIFPRVVRTISESCPYYFRELSVLFPRVGNALFESWHHVFFLRSQCLHYRSYLESSVTDEFTYSLLMGLSKQQISGEQYNLHQRIEI